MASFGHWRSVLHGKEISRLRSSRPFFFVLLLLVFGCQDQLNYLSHRLDQVSVKHYPDRQSIWINRDLTGDSRDEFITATSNEPYHSTIRVKTIEGSQLTEYSIPGEVTAMEVIRHPLEGTNWLLISAKDEHKAWLTGIVQNWNRVGSKQVFNFEPIRRSNNPKDNPDLLWIPVLQPLFMDDIDSDGALEIVCRASDPFHAHPRGIYVFAVSDGALKWSYRTQNPVQNVLFADLDGDGHRKFIISTRSERLADTVPPDNRRACIITVDHFGRHLLSFTCIKGQGRVHLHDHVIDNAGVPEVLAVESDQNFLIHENTLSIYRITAGQLKRIQSQSIDVMLSYDAGIYLAAKGELGGLILTLLDGMGNVMAFDEQLNRLTLPNTPKLERIYHFADLTKDGFNEILALSKDNRIVILDYNFKLRSQIPNPFPDERQVTARIVAGGYGKENLISVSSPGKMAIYRFNANNFWQYIVMLLGGYWHIAPLLLTFLILLVLTDLLQQKRVMRAVHIQSKQSVIRINGSLRILSCNIHFMDNLARSPRHIKSYLSDLCPELVENVLQFIKSREPACNSVLTLPSIDGSTLHDVLIMRFRKLFALRFLIILTPIRQLDDDLRAKLNWVDISRMLSHHVRRHITNVILALEPIEAELPSDSYAASALKLIRNEIDKIKIFTHTFQRFTELERIEPTQIELGDFIRKLIPRITAPDRIKLDFELPEQPLEVLCEPIRLGEVMLNLINNSCEAIEAVGNVWIEVSNDPDNKEFARIIIQDNGSGIEEKYLTDIWKPFFTTKQQGTGIGLPEARKLIESMHGDIYLTSTYGEGTTVTISLKKMLSTV